MSQLLDPLADVIECDSPFSLGGYFNRKKKLTPEEAGIVDARAIFKEVRPILRSAALPEIRAKSTEAISN
jgi:hypothetical protein